MGLARSLFILLTLLCATRCSVGAGWLWVGGAASLCLGLAPLLVLLDLGFVGQVLHLVVYSLCLPVILFAVKRFVFVSAPMVFTVLSALRA
jgi:hypothetical protein